MVRTKKPRKARKTHKVVSKKVVAVSDNDDETVTSDETQKVGHESKKLTEKEIIDADKQLPFLMWWEKLILVVMFVAASAVVGWEVVAQLRSSSLHHSEAISISDHLNYIHPPKESLAQIAQRYRDASIDFYLPSEEPNANPKRVEIKRQQPGFGKPQSATSHEFPEEFHNMVVFGIGSSLPEYVEPNQNQSRIANQLEELVTSMRMLNPDLAIRCDFKNPKMKWVEEGRCFFFRKSTPRHSVLQHPQQKQHHHSVEFMNIEQQVLGIAQKFHQPAIYNWWEHTWGYASPSLDPRGRKDSVTMMQSILPCSPSLEDLKDHRQVLVQQIM